MKKKLKLNWWWYHFLTIWKTKLIKWIRKDQEALKNSQTFWWRYAANRFYLFQIQTSFNSFLFLLSLKQNQYLNSHQIHLKRSKIVVSFYLPHALFQNWYTDHFQLRIKRRKIKASRINQRLTFNNLWIQGWLVSIC